MAKKFSEHEGHLGVEAIMIELHFGHFPFGVES